MCDVWRGLVAKVSDDRLSGRGKYESVSLSRRRTQGAGSNTVGSRGRLRTIERRVFGVGMTDRNRIYSIEELFIA